MNKVWCFNEIIDRKVYEKMPTLQLIREMRRLDYNFECGEYIYAESNCPNYQHCRANRQLNIMTMHDILKTRPHIPNTPESKKIRQYRAKYKIKMTSPR